MSAMPLSFCWVKRIHIVDDLATCVRRLAGLIGELHGPDAFQGWAV